MPRYLTFNIDGQLLLDISRDTEISLSEIESVVANDWGKEAPADLAIKEISGATLAAREQILKRDSPIESFFDSSRDKIVDIPRDIHEQWIKDNYPENLAIAEKFVITAGKPEPK